MNLETIIKRMDALEERIQDYDKIFKNFNDTIADLNNKVTNLPAEYHDLKDEIGQLRKSIAGIGNFDKALTQIRKDTNEKIENLEKEAKKQQEQQTNLYQSDMRSLSAKVDRLDTKVKSELDKKIQRYIEEDSHVLSTVERIEQSVNTKLKSDEDVRRNHEIQKRDIQSISKRLEILGDDVSQFQKTTGGYHK